MVFKAIKKFKFKKKAKIFFYNSKKKNNQSLSTDEYFY